MSDQIVFESLIWQLGHVKQRNGHNAVSAMCAEYSTLPNVLSFLRLTKREVDLKLNRKH